MSASIIKFVICFHLASIISCLETSQIFSVSPFEKKCTCVPFYLCTDEENGVIISDGRGLIEVRQDQNNGGCENYFDVCCNITLPPPTPEPVINSHGCGNINPNMSYPWSASLYYKDSRQSKITYKCRVSFIHKTVAITAAHCIVKQGFYSIKIGTYQRPVLKAITHPGFKKNSLQNDVALLVMNGPFQSVGTPIVCLPPPGSILDSKNCITATTEKGDKNEGVTTVNLPMVERSKCLEAMRRTRLGIFFQLHDSFVCAGGELNKDTCGGDGGTPLLCPIPGLPRRFQQVGIVSWGIGCGGEAPGIYVNLGVFRDWIDEVMIMHKLEVNTYRY